MIELKLNLMIAKISREDLSSVIDINLMLLNSFLKALI